MSEIVVGEVSLCLGVWLFAPNWISSFWFAVGDYFLRSRNCWNGLSTVPQGRPTIEHTLHTLPLIQAATLNWRRAKSERVQLMVTVCQNVDRCYGAQDCEPVSSATPVSLSFLWFFYAAFSKDSNMLKFHFDALLTHSSPISMSRENTY